MTLMLSIPILLILLAFVSVRHGLHADRPREIPRSHAVDPRFLPPARR